MREILFRGKEFSALTNYCWLFGSLDTTEMGYKYFGSLVTEIIGNIHDNPELLEV